MIRRVRSGSPFEERYAYARAVIAGNMVYIAGTCAHSDDMPTDTRGQCASALRVIKDALHEAGTDFAHVVRVVYYVVDITEFAGCAPELRDAFGDTPPAATIVEARLIDPVERI